MIIKIRDNNESLILTDEELDNPNFVELNIGEEELTVDLDELLSAVHAFEQKRIIRLHRLTTTD